MLFLIFATPTLRTAKVLCILVITTFIACNLEKNKSKSIYSAQAKIANIKAAQISQLGNSKKVKAYLDSAYRTITNPSTKDLFEKYNTLALNYLNTNFDANMAYIYADSMLLSIEKNKQDYNLEYAQSLFIKGDVASAQKDYRSAFRFYYDARQYAIETLSPCEYYAFTSRLGVIRFKQQKYLQAIEYSKKAFAESKNCTDEQTVDDIHKSKQSYLNTIALGYERLGTLDSAIYYYQNALDFINLTAKKYPAKASFMLAAKGVVYGNLGGVLVKHGDYRRGRYYLKESIRINGYKGFEQLDAQTAKLKLAEMHISLAELDSANYLLGELEYLDLHPKQELKLREDNRIKLYGLLSKLSAQKGDLKNAYAYNIKYHQLQNELNIEQQSLREADLEMAFKTIDQQYELSALEKQDKRKTIYLISALGFIAFLMISLFIGYRNRKQLQALNTKISSQNLALAKLTEDLQQSQLDNTNMMNFVVHDLRSPIAATIGIARILKEDLKGENLKLVKLMEQANEQSLEMISDLLSYGTTPKDIKIEPLQLSELISNCVELLSIKAAEKQQHLELDIDQIEVKADKEKLSRVIYNIIGNAIKFSQVASTIKIKTEISMDHVLIIIVDHGVGIPNHFKEEVFTAFGKARRQGTAGEASFGLGLSISKQIILLHGGNLWFDSDPETGTTFYIKLPI